MHDSVMTVGVFGRPGDRKIPKRKRLSPDLVRNCRSCPSKLITHLRQRLVWTIVLGIVIVLGYAAIRPRFGAGAKTAIIAALFAWFGCYVYCGIINALLFGIPMNTMLIVLVWGLVEYIIAALVGAWLYKEG